MNPLQQKHREILFSLKELYKLIKEFCEELFKAADYNLSSDKKIDFNIVDSPLKKKLELSGKVGEEIAQDLLNLEGKDKEKFARKWTVTDYVVGMTDLYIIKEYERLTFRSIKLV